MSEFARSLTNYPRCFTDYPRHVPYAAGALFLTQAV